MRNKLLSVIGQEDSQVGAAVPSPVQSVLLRVPLPPELPGQLSNSSVCGCGEARCAMKTSTKRSSVRTL